MCGIFGYVGNETNVGKLCFEALKQLEYRGYDSWGIAAFNESLEIEKHIGKLPETFHASFEGKMVIGHSRWATHGGITEENTHPHFGKNGAVVVHNGVVENHIDLKQFLLRQGVLFRSETDTENIVHLYEYFRAKYEPLESFIQTIKKVEGNNAIVLMDVEVNILLAHKSGSPLVLGSSCEGYFIASDVSPLLKNCTSVYYVENDEFIILDKDKVSLYDQKTKSFREPIWQKPTIKLEEVSLGEHQHFLIKEIKEQPKILRDIALFSEDNLLEMKNLILGASDVCFTGCGSAFYAGLAANYFAAEAKKFARSIYAHELPSLLGCLTESSLVVALSQSGETIDVIDAINATNEKNIKTSAFVNVPTSSLSRLVKQTLPLQAGPEICVLSTKAFTAMVANLFAIYHSEELFRSKLLSAADQMEDFINQNNSVQIETIANLICKKNSLFLIGTGQYYPLALEAALKIKEVSYVHAEAFASGELKHGVIALIEEGTPCIVFAPEDKTGERIKIHASEIRARGGNVICISEDKLDPVDKNIKVSGDGINYFFTALAAMQLLAYRCALIKGYDPDKPRNLAKSVTVR